MPILEVEHIEKSFENTEVLKDISFTLEKGQVLSIIGSSGSGKTTLLRCLNFLERADSGIIKVNDEVIFDSKSGVKLKDSAMRKNRLHFGLVFQSFNLFPQYTAIENVMLARQLLAKEQPDYKSNKKAILSEIRKEAEELLGQMGLADRMDNYPHQLSGGQCQRVAIARALALHPDILCFDEPTSALDPELTGEVLKVIKELADKDTFMEVQSGFAKNIIVGFMRMEGHTVGVVANQPEFMAGSLDYNAGDKGGRFIRFCDCFNIPILTLVDVPAFLPGKSQEYNGIIRHGAKLLYAYSEATVPMVTVILRKAFGGAYIGMDSKGIGADFVFAWPIAQIAVMGAEGAVNIIAKRKIEESEDPEAARAEAIAEYENKFMNPYVAASRGYVDEVIRPDETKERVVKAFDMLSQKKRVKIPKKHGNMPV